MCQFINLADTERVAKRARKGMTMYKVVEFYNPHSALTVNSENYSMSWGAGVRYALRRDRKRSTRKRHKFDENKTLAESYFGGPGIYCYKTRAVALENRYRGKAILPVRVHERDLIGANSRVAIFSKVTVTPHGWTMFVNRLKRG